MSDMRDVEVRLTDLAGAIEWPEADLHDRVLGRIVARRRTWTQRLLVATVVAVVILGIVAVPGSRQALADFLQVVGIEIQWLGDGIDVDQTELGLTGEPVDLTSAATAIDFDLSRPERLDRPDLVYRTGEGVVMVWAPSRTLPESLPGSGVGLILEQFPAMLDEPLMSKGVVEGTDVEVVSIGDTRGYAITGPPHTVYYRVGSVVRESPSRLAANVLVWESGGVVRRLEGAMARDRLIELAESLIPVVRG